MSIYKDKQQKTKNLIQKSFLEILAQKTFEAITIGDIAKAAQINRGTFYLHYLDKYDLLEQIEQQIFIELGQHVGNLQKRYLTIMTFEMEQEQLSDLLFEFIADHASTLKILLSDHGRAGFHLRFKEAFTEQVRDNLERHEEFYMNLEVPKDYFLSFITSAFLGLIEQWIQNELDKSAQEMTTIYIGIIRFIQKRK